MNYSDLKYDIEEFESDQDKKLPQPPLVKAAMRKDSIELPKNFDALSVHSNFLDIINTRHSSRVYTQEPMSLLELSYMLWTCQGVKQIRGKKYATLRTVPSGGARHGFELYFVCQNVEGLNPGTFHYLPMEHRIFPLLYSLAMLDSLGGTTGFRLHGLESEMLCSAVPLHGWYWADVPD